MSTEVIRQVKAEGSDLVAMVNGVEVFRGRAGAIVDKAYNIVEAVSRHEGEFKVESEIRENRRMYFVKAGNMILKESASAGKIHDFADRLNGASKAAPALSEPHVEQEPQGDPAEYADGAQPPQADDEDLFADQ
jgi:hypothetical protein